MKVFVQELKRTLHKDINKKMCETLAFFMYEKWWQEQEEKYKTKVCASISPSMQKNWQMPCRLSDSKTAV